MKKILLFALVLTTLTSLSAQERIDVSGSGPGIKEIHVTNEGFVFTPAEIVVKKGDIIRLTFTNGGGLHDWVLDEFNAATKKISGGRADTIEFVADTAGAFEFYCSVGNHRAMGMWGKFTVVN